jgi:hypothetical protein
VKRLAPVCLAAVASACALAPPQTGDSSSGQALHIRLLYALNGGGVFRYDEISSAPGCLNFREVRADRDETFTRYSFALHPEGPEHWWTSL